MDRVSGEGRVKVTVCKKKTHITQRERKIRMMLDSSSEIVKARRHWIKYLKH